MLKRIKSMFAQKPDGNDNNANDENRLKLAASALLVEAAVMDGDFDDDERATIEKLLQERFELSSAEARDLISEAEQAVEGSVELYGFARTIKDTLEHDQRIEIIEMLWQVVLADGEVHHYESNLIRRLAGLIYISDRESGAAKKRVLEGLGNNTSS